MFVFILGIILKTVFFLLWASLLILIGLSIYNKVCHTMCTCKADLSGKIILITGGNAGLGFESAKILAKRGARIIIASRNVAKSKEAVQAIIDATGNPNIESKPLDLSKLSSVKEFAEDFNKSYDRLDVLINNAGMGDLVPQMTEDRIEKTMQINHVGPVYLTNLLREKLIASKPSRIIFVSSRGYMFNYLDPSDLIEGKSVEWLPNAVQWVYRYGNTKLCNILTAKALSKILPDGVTANSLHPGLAKTEIFEGAPAFAKKILYFIIDNFYNTPEECSQTTVHLASAPALANVTGEYFDECKITKTNKSVTDELADQVWKNTLQIIEDRVKNAEYHNKLVDN